MRHMPSLKSNLAQALWWLTILASFYLLLKRFINEFYHWFTNFDGLERRQLWLNPCHCRSTHNNSLLRANQGNHWRLWPCWGHHWRGNEASQSSGLNHHQLGVAFQLKVMIIAMLFPSHQIKAIHYLLSADGQPD